MNSITAKIKPANGFSHLVHIGLTSLLPALVFIFVRIHFVQLAVAIILLSKWRILAVKPRHWPANIRANTVDIMVGLSIVIFMTHTNSQLLQLIWSALYAAWLLILKPRSTLLPVSSQAFVGQFVALVALFLNWGESGLWLLALASWAICYSAARHFFTSFEDGYGRFLSYCWGFFAAALVWSLGHWLLFYSVISQPTLLLCVLGLGLGSLYYLDKTDRLSIIVRRQLIFVMIAIVVIVITFSDWGDKTV